MWPTGPEWTSRPDDDSPGGSLATVAGLTCGLRGGTIDGRPPTGSTPTPPQEAALDPSVVVHSDPGARVQDPWREPGTEVTAGAQRRSLSPVG